MSTKIIRGSIEEIVVDVEDVLEAITTLEGISCYYQYGADEDTLSSYVSVTSIDEMRLTCVINTTLMDKGAYLLFVKFDIPPIHPRLRFVFSVI